MEQKRPVCDCPASGARHLFFLAWGFSVSLGLSLPSFLPPFSVYLSATDFDKLLDSRNWVTHRIFMFISNLQKPN